MPLITPNLAGWQYQNYSKNHTNKLSLILHLLSSPIFILANLALVYFLIETRWLEAAYSLAALPVVVILQGIGHKREAIGPDPFQSPLDFFARFYTENFFTFWRYVFSGQWATQFKK